MPQLGPGTERVSIPITGATVMFTRVLTERERRRIQAYLRADGEKSTAIRQLVTRAKRHTPAIRSDLELLEKLLQAYIVK
jgi:hypothetical protein